MDFLFYDILFSIIFCIAVGIFLYKNKKKVKREGIVFLYRTKFGIGFIENLAKKHKKFFNFVTKINIVIGFIGMAAIFLLLIASCYKMAVMPKAAVTSTPPIVPLLPWIPFPGLPTLYFTIWIISISLLAIVHEGYHGVFARLNKIKLKSTGFGFLGPVALAFVEPDEKQLMKKSPKVQLSVFAAGPVANFITAGIIFLIITFAIDPAYGAAVKDIKIQVLQVGNNTPAYLAGIEKNDMISISNISQKNLSALASFFLEMKPNQTISVNIENKNKIVDVLATNHPTNSSRGYVGIKEIKLVPEFEGINKIMPFLESLFIWMLLTNIFVGLFNLLPFWVADGGRMFYAAAFALTKSKKKSLMATKKATQFSLFLIFMIFAIWVIRMFFG